MHWLACGGASPTAGYLTRRLRPTKRSSSHDVRLSLYWPQSSLHTHTCQYVHCQGKHDKSGLNRRSVTRVQTRGQSLRSRLGAVWLSRMQLGKHDAACDCMPCKLHAATEKACQARFAARWDTHHRCCGSILHCFCA